MIKDNQNQKNLLRISFANLREKCLATNHQSILFEVENSLKKLIALNKNEKYIGIYWPLKGEVDLRSLYKSSTRNLALPASNKNKEITYHPWIKMPLEKDFLKIPSPTKERVLNPEEISLLLIPALSIDKSGYRLGYGGGYFDRLRSKKRWKNIPSFIVIPQICVSNDPLPKDHWDIPFDGWISEKGLHEVQPDQSLVR